MTVSITDRHARWIISNISGSIHVLTPDTFLTRYGQLNAIMTHLIIKRFTCFLLCLFFGLNHPARAQENAKEIPMQEIDRKIRTLMEEGDIPGLSVIIIKGNRQIIKSYGFTDLESREAVTENTLFELGSCSKAFTALAVATLVFQNKLKLDDPVTAYIPWLTLTYEGKAAAVTIRQLLHHTSGIPWSTISKIPATNAVDALELTVRQLTGQKLNHLPGDEYEYATINYNVLALIVQNITGQTFESYLQEHVFKKLDLRSTTIGEPANSALKATGYKIGFFKARQYNAPVFRGNNAAGYVVSNAMDIAKWLRFQMGLSHDELHKLAQFTHQRDETVPLHYMSSYAMGWEISFRGDGEIYHSGLNPNFTAHVAFRPKQKIGVAVLANSNSSFTNIIGSSIMKLCAGEKIEKEFHPGDENDKAFAIISFITSAYILVVAAFLFMIVTGIAKRKREFSGFSLHSFAGLGLFLVNLFPFVLGLYLLPTAMGDFTWHSIMVWTPVSVPVSLALIITSFGVSYLAYAMSLFFPEKDNLKRVIPRLILLSILSGLANMAVIVLITSAIGSNVALKYLVFYYILALSLYLLGRRYVQVRLIRVSRTLTYELRLKLIDKIFSTTYQKFENMDRGRVYTTLNDDVSTVGDSASLFVVIITSLITSIGAFLYLATIAFWATALTGLLMAAIAVIYYLTSKNANKYLEEARETRNLFMRLTNGVIDGFKEISLHSAKKLEYKADVEHAADAYRTKTSTANIQFVNAFVTGEMLLISLLGCIVFIIPELFPGMPVYIIMSFVMVLLYLLGPINGILNAVPAVMQLKIALNRIREFTKEIPASIDLKASPQPIDRRIESLEVKGVRFHYKDKDGRGTFAVGPIDLKVAAGEILFIVGGNGSGKTTLAKLLTGLYEPDEGEICINDKALKSSQLGEYFSAVFSPYHLFEKIYGVNTDRKSEATKQYLQMFGLDDKVEVIGNAYSTTGLSGGQRKRLALLQCYLEDHHIYLFDEWAADQDPGYRDFFYKTLLPELREMGKIVIAITHDDRYFGVADKVLRMNHGVLDHHAEEKLAAHPAA